MDRCDGARYKYSTHLGFYDLTGMTAIVTGAAGGIGQAIADRLARAGARVAVADLDCAEVPMRISNQKAARWRKRFLQAGLAGLEKG